MDIDKNKNNNVKGSTEAVNECLMIGDPKMKRCEELGKNDKLGLGFIRTGLGRVENSMSQ